MGSHQPTGLPSPSPRPGSATVGRTRGQGCSSSSQTREMGGAKGAGEQGHSPLLIFMSQEKILHLLPPEVQLVVIVALDCLGLIHRVIQG